MWLQDHRPTLVDYRVDVEDSIEILSRASLCVGYHGGASWLARWCGCPQVVLSDDPGGITSKSFAQAIVTDRLPDALERTKQEARLKLERFRGQYEKWLTEH